MQQHGLAESVACIWLSVWAIRKRYEVDETLDHTMQVVRWVTVVAAWGLNQNPGSRWAACALSQVLSDWASRAGPILHITPSACFVGIGTTGHLNDKCGLIWSRS